MLIANTALARPAAYVANCAHVVETIVLVVTATPGTGVPDPTATVEYFVPMHW